MTSPRLALAALLLASSLYAQETKQEPRKDLAANLCVRGKLLFSDDFSAAELSKEWKIAKGKWEIADGALKGSELAADMHAAVIKHALPSKNVVLQFSFKFDGAKNLACSFDGKGHVCRVALSPAGFQLRRDVAKDSGEKPVVLGKAAIDLRGDWHTMLVEIQGREMLAQVDDKAFAFGENEGVDAGKATFGFPSSGESVRIREIRVWEAGPNPDWPANKEKLAAGK
jgi:hypothetical protein